MAAIICYQLADALLYLHKYGIMHIDFLKVENIKVNVTKNDLDKDIPDLIEVKIMDFV